jgi:hypothetical protein
MIVHPRPKTTLRQALLSPHEIAIDRRNYLDPPIARMVESMDGPYAVHDLITVLMLHTEPTDSARWTELFHWVDSINDQEEFEFHLFCIETMLAPPHNMPSMLHTLWQWPQTHFEDLHHLYEDEAVAWYTVLLKCCTSNESVAPVQTFLETYDTWNVPSNWSQLFAEIIDADVWLLLTRNAPHLTDMNEDWSQSTIDYVAALRSLNYPEVGTSMLNPIRTDDPVFAGVADYHPELLAADILTLLSAKVIGNESLLQCAEDDVYAGFSNIPIRLLFLVLHANNATLTEKTFPTFAFELDTEYWFGEVYIYDIDQLFHQYVRLLPADLEQLMHNDISKSIFIGSEYYPFSIFFGLAILASKEKKPIIIGLCHTAVNAIYEQRMKINAQSNLLAIDALCACAPFTENAAYMTSAELLRKWLDTNGFEQLFTEADAKDFMDNPLEHHWNLEQRLQTLERLALPG